MENETTYSSNLGQANESNLMLSPSSKIFLRETAKWSNFISIIGFIGIGLMVLASFFIGSIFSMIPNYNQAMPFPTFFLSGIYLILALIYFFPVYYLYQFSSKLKRAFAHEDNTTLESSFEYLKSHYKFLGIFTIVMISFYILMLIFWSVAAAAIM